MGCFQPRIFNRVLEQARRSIIQSTQPGNLKRLLAKIKKNIFHILKFNVPFQIKKSSNIRKGSAYNLTRKKYIEKTFLLKISQILPFSVSRKCRNIRKARLMHDFEYQISGNFGERKLKKLISIKTVI